MTPALTLVSPNLFRTSLTAPVRRTSPHPPTGGGVVRKVRKPHFTALYRTFGGKVRKLPTQLPTAFQPARSASLPTDRARR